MVQRRVGWFSLTRFFFCFREGSPLFGAMIATTLVMGRELLSKAASAFERCQFSTVVTRSTIRRFSILPSPARRHFVGIFAASDRYRKNKLKLWLPSVNQRNQ